MEDEAELILLGYVVFFDAPKSSAASALQKLEQLHVQVKVLTGDQKCNPFHLPEAGNRDRTYLNRRRNGGAV